MNLSLLLEMTAEGSPDRVAFGSLKAGLTYGELLKRSRAGAAHLVTTGCERLVFLGTNSDLLPVALFAASKAGIPFVPLNYRLADDRLRQLVARTSPSLLLTSPEFAERVIGLDGVRTIDSDDFLLDITKSDDLPISVESSPDDVAIMLFTSGTTGDPKAALLRHDHLASYIISTVDFLASEADEATLVCVPPYHIAGISAILSSTYSGRRIVYLPQFDAESWVLAVQEESITHAMVVPTMLSRIMRVLDDRGEPLPSLRHLSYGGGRMPSAVIEHALEMLPGVDFVNAYGLTETSSTIAILDSEDHRIAAASNDRAARARLASVGRPIPDLEIEIRDEDGHAVAANAKGEIWVRGGQVSGEYEGIGSLLTDDGWFPTRDAGFMDVDGYLFVEGRIDDVIVRGGENISPGEIEDVLITHAAVAECAVVGVPDTEWGEVAVAFIVRHEDSFVSPEELSDLVARRLRSSRRPSTIVFRDELPYSETGKLLRRVLKEDFQAAL